MLRFLFAFLLLLSTACAGFTGPLDARITPVTLAGRAFDSAEDELDFMAHARGADAAKAQMALAEGWIAKGREALENERRRRAAMYLERVRAQLDLIRLEIRKAHLGQALECELERQEALEEKIEELENALNRERSPSARARRQEGAR